MTCFVWSKFQFLLEISRFSFCFFSVLVISSTLHHVVYAIFKFRTHIFLLGTIRYWSISLLFGIWPKTANTIFHILIKYNFVEFCQVQRRKKRQRWCPNPVTRRQVCTFCSMRGSRSMSTPVMSVQGTAVSVSDCKARVTRLSELTDWLLVDPESSVYIILSQFHPSYILTIYFFKIHLNIEEKYLLGCYAVYLEDGQIYGCWRPQVIQNMGYYN